MAQAGTQSCITVVDPSTLAADVVGSKPSDVDRIEVTLETPNAPSTTQTATIDAIGNWSATFTLLPGFYTADAKVFLTDGSTASDRTFFTVRSGTVSYVALGDSFSAGEGVRPFLGEDPNGQPDRTSIDFLCHRSTKGYPRLVQLKGASKPISQDTDASFTFAACSGATIVHFDTKPQEKTRSE